MERLVSFPVGGGELGALIRAFDWSATNLGPIESWPQSLRTATDIVLQSPLPLVMLWGPDGIMIYNDAYSVFAGARHPRLLGSKVLEGWAEVADFNAHVMAVGLAGGTLSFKDQELTLFRNNVPEQVWMDLNYGPVLDESGRPGGVLAIVVETTGRVRGERRQRFLFELGERLHNLATPDEIAACSLALLGAHMDAIRTGWCRPDKTGGLRVEAEWTAGNSARLQGHAIFQGDAAGHLQALQSERAVILSDPDNASASFGADDGTAAAALVMPVLESGRLMAALFVHSRTPRRWTEDEAALLRDVAERSWGALQRAEAAVRLRDSEENFRALVNATSDVVYRMSPDWKEMRQLDGRGFISDTAAPSGRWLGEYIFAEDQFVVLQAIDKAIRSKSVFQLEHRVRRIDGSAGWTFSRAVPVLDEAGEIVEWFGAASDVTSRKQTEEHLRLVINELNHRVKNNLAMIQAIAAQTLRNADDLEGAQSAFSARILALADANDLLTEEGWVDASLAEIIESAIRPHAAVERRRIEGPPVRLSAKTSLSVSMALHELATNALKHGAWSNEAGSVAITWQIRQLQSGERLRLEWREQGGPPVVPPKKRGFGSRLVERGLAAELAGAVKLRFEPGGLVCEIEAPLPRELARVSEA